MKNHNSDAEYISVVVSSYKAEGMAALWYWGQSFSRFREYCEKKLEEAERAGETEVEREIKQAIKTLDAIKPKLR